MARPTDPFRGSTNRRASIAEQRLGWFRDSSSADDRRAVAQLIAGRTRANMWIRRPDLAQVTWLDGPALEMALFGLWRRCFIERLVVTRAFEDGRTKLAVGDTLYQLTATGMAWAREQSGVHPPPHWLKAPPWIVPSRR